MKLLTTLMLTIFVAVCLAGTPAFSGEHPWDNDNQHPGTTGSPNGSGSDDTTFTRVLIQCSGPTGRTEQGTNASSLTQRLTWTAVFRLGTVVVGEFFGVTGRPAPVQVKRSVQMRRSNW